MTDDEPKPLTDEEIGEDRAHLAAGGETTWFLLAQWLATVDDLRRRLEEAELLVEELRQRDLLEEIRRQILGELDGAGLGDAVPEGRRDLHLGDMVEKYIVRALRTALAERDAAIARAEEENAQAACGHQMRFAHYETKNECYLCDLDDAERERDELGAKLAKVRAARSVLRTVSTAHTVHAPSVRAFIAAVDSALDAAPATDAVVGWSRRDKPQP